MLPYLTVQAGVVTTFEIISLLQAFVLRFGKVASNVAAARLMWVRNS